MVTETVSSAPTSARPTNKIRSRPKMTLWGLIVRIFFAAVFSLPLLFMLFSSLKPDAQIFSDIDSFRAFLPVGDVSFDHYAAVFERVPAGQFMLNSVFISVLTVGLGIIVNSMCAFALARMKVRFKGVILTVVIATLMVPFETLALPLLWWVNKLPGLRFDEFGPYFAQGWIDTYQVQLVPFIANAFSIYLFYQYFDSIPKELDEAARVDGAGWFRIYSRIIMPLSGPAIATVAILAFLPIWNAYLWPLMVVQTESMRPVMVGIQYFFQLNVSWGEIMAYSSLITLPVVALFICFQRAFVNSIAASGVKG